MPPRKQHANRTNSKPTSSIDAQRKRDIILFLYENKLIHAESDFKVDLRGADLNGVRFAKSSALSCELDSLYLPSINAENIIFDECTLHKAVFQDSEMSGATFQSCLMESTEFTNANLTGARLHDNDLHRSSFVGSTLRRSSIKGGTFGQVDLSNADLYRSVISAEQLFTLSSSVMKPNTLVNTRLPNGSFTPIKVDTTIGDRDDEHKVRKVTRRSAHLCIAISSVFLLRTRIASVLETRMVLLHLVLT